MALISEQILGFKIVCKKCDEQILDANPLDHELKCVKEEIDCLNCNKTMPKSELDEHLQKCITVNCKWCGQKTLNLEEHNKACARYPEVCKYCGDIMSRNKIENHEKNTCEKYPEKNNVCSLCGIQYQTSEKEHHIATECIGANKICPFCDVTTNNMNQHLTTCVGVNKCSKCDWIGDDVRKHNSLYIGKLINIKCRSFIDTGYIIYIGLKHFIVRRNGKCTHVPIERTDLYSCGRFD